MPVDSNRAGADVVETGHGHRHRRLPTSARADEGKGLAGFDPQADAPQHLRTAVVGEPDVVEDDLACERRQLQRVGRIDYRRFQVEQLEDPLGAGSCLLADGQDAREHPGGRHELGQVGREGEKRPERDLVADRQVPAERQHADLANAWDGLEQRLVTGLEADGAHLRAVQFRCGGHYALELAALLAERLHDADPVHVLVDDLGDVALSLLAVPGGREDPPAHSVRDEKQSRRDQRAHDRQQGREVDHDPEREHQHEDVAAHDRKEAEEALYERRVGIGAGHELAGRHAVEIREVEALQVALHGVSEVVLDVERHAATPIAPEVGPDEGHDAESEKRHDPGRERRGVAHDYVVDDLALDERDDDLGNAAHDRTGEGDDEIALVDEQVTAETPHPTAGTPARVVDGPTGSLVCHPLARWPPAHRRRSAAAWSIAVPSATSAPITSSRRPVRAASASRLDVIARSAASNSSAPASVRLNWTARWSPATPERSSSPRAKRVDRGAHRGLAKGKANGDSAGPLVAGGDRGQHPVMGEAQSARGSFHHLRGPRERLDRFDGAGLGRLGCSGCGVAAAVRDAPRRRLRGHKGECRKNGSTTEPSSSTKGWHACRLSDLWPSPNPRASEAW